MKKKVKSPPEIIVALDTPSLDVTEKLLKDLKGVIGFYKIGFELFTAHGWNAVDLVRKYGGKIFLDLKLHDIPNTASKTAAVICEHEIEMFNVHALGGFDMMKSVREMVASRVKTGKRKPIVLAVTILTSHTEDDLSREMGISKNMKDEVLMLARLAKAAGLDGVVSSPQETALLRKELTQDFVIVTPGVRPEGSAKDDQERIFTPKDAVKAGSDFLVIGRPIVAAGNPKQAAMEILAQIK